MAFRRKVKKKHNNNRLLLRLVLLLLMLGITGSIPFIAWKYKSPVYLNIAILSKTVPDTTYREHKGLMWLLNNMKYFNKSKNGPFEYNRDYFGFFPLEKGMYDIYKLPEDISGKMDLIYIADTYGVYEDDYYKKDPRSERSELIYGGITKDEVNTISELLDKNTIISEFNTITSPMGEAERNTLSSAFGITWRGWIGRYFNDLSRGNTEIPLWLIDDYEKQYGMNWDFKGPGLAFVRSDNTVFILRQGKEIGKNLNSIVFTDNALKEFQVKNNAKCYCWFEIIGTDPKVETIANYILDTTAKGEEILQKYGLKNKFPAITRKKAGYTAYYFAGDFADNNRTPSLWNASGAYFLNKISTIDVKGSQVYFYWNVYYPMMEKILRDISSNRIQYR